jgi:hypothetical protein
MDHSTTGPRIRLHVVNISAYFVLLSIIGETAFRKLTCSTHSKVLVIGDLSVANYFGMQSHTLFNGFSDLLRR